MSTIFILFQDTQSILWSEPFDIIKNYTARRRKGRYRNICLSNSLLLTVVKLANRCSVENTEKVKVTVDEYNIAIYLIKINEQI